MRNFAILVSIIVVLFISGCQQQGPYGQVCYPLDEEGNPVIPQEDLTQDTVSDLTDEPISIIDEEQPSEDDIIEDEPETAAEEEQEDDVIVIEDDETFTEPPAVEEETEEIDVYMEGDLIDLSKYQAVDEDGDPLDYVYEEPFNEDGEWQTSVGDAGTYTTTITVTDGTNSATLDVDFKVESANQAPEFVQLNDVEVNAGNEVSLDFEVEDPENDEVEITYSGWMTSSTKETTEEDVGEHIVTVIASDGINTVSEEITVTVLEKNDPPVFEPMQDRVVNAGEVIDLDPVVTDPEGDEITVTYTEPLNDEGKWDTEGAEPGMYVLQILASDGQNEVINSVRVFVQEANQPPVIEAIDPIIVEETDTIILEPEISDPEGDAVDVTFSGWMTSDTKVTGYDDEGEYTVTITASDGQNEVSMDVEIVVLNKNRPPTFVG